MSFSTASKPVVSFCISVSTTACLHLALLCTLLWKHPDAPRSFWCSLSTTMTPQKDQEPQIYALAGFFCPWHINAWNTWSWSEELLLVWLQLFPTTAVAQGSLAAHFWNRTSGTILAAASFSFACSFSFTHSSSKPMLSSGTKGLENHLVFWRDRRYYLNPLPVCCTLMLLMERKCKHEVWTSPSIPLR